MYFAIWLLRFEMVDESSGMEDDVLTYNEVLLRGACTVCTTLQKFAM